jgi:hypothetical protein
MAIICKPRADLMRMIASVDLADAVQTHATFKEAVSGVGSLFEMLRTAEIRLTKRGLGAIQVDEGGAQPEADERGDTEQRADLALDKPSRLTAARRRKDRRTSSAQPAKPSSPVRSRCSTAAEAQPSPPS